MNEIAVSALNEAVNTYKKSPERLLVADKSNAFKYLNHCSDGVVGHNHIYFSANYTTHLIYYMLSDDAKFTILEIREVD